MEDILKKIYDYSLEEIMGDRYGRYAKTIIQDRAIPDVRDGLKPVQRRILFSMYKEKNTYDKAYRKSARAVGDVMGKYHPHGDSSIYDAMIRMSQHWKLNTPFIDVQGNNGSIDGDSPAAMRYTEARLSKVAMELIKDIDLDTVNFAPNYDDTLMEPTVLPARFPNLLVNGTTGISAGYATNIPPHNLGEIIDATIKRIDSPNCTLDTILEIVKGPDFPTGGIVQGKQGLIDAYETGKGRVIIRSKVEFCKEKKTEQIVVHEIPYEVNKAALIRKIDEIRIDKKIEGMAEVRDESDRENSVRIVIDLKANADKDLILNYLYKNTELQISYNFNMVSIVNNRPMLLGIRPMLDAYIKHQKEFITRRCNFKLDHDKARYHIVEGLIKAISILDEVIALIRKSKNKQDSINNLVKEFDFTYEQAEAIVVLQLYRLSNTDIVLLEEEKEMLEKRIAALIEILSDEEKLKDLMKHELEEIKKEYATDRKTKVEEEIKEIKIDATAMIPKEDVVVVVTREGYVKRVSNRSYSASSDEDTLVKPGDYVIGSYNMNTMDTLLIFTDLGNYLYIPVHELPDLKWKELGKHVSNVVSIKPDENVVASLAIYNFEEDKNVTIFTKNGMVKQVAIKDFKVERHSKPITAIKLKDDDKVVAVSFNTFDEVFISTNKGYGLWYDISEIPVIGTKTSGVKAINLKDDYVVSAHVFSSSVTHLSVITDKGTGKRIALTEFDKTSRAKRGLLLIRDIKTNPHSVVKTFIEDGKVNFGIKNKEFITTLKINTLPISDRYSAGSNIFKGDIDEVFKIIDKPLKEDDFIKEDESVEEALPKEDVSLKEIDDRIMTIDDFLNDFND